MRKTRESGNFFINWSGRWESNPRPKLGKLLYYHCTTPALAKSIPSITSSLGGVQEVGNFATAPELTGGKDTDSRLDDFVKNRKGAEREIDALRAPGRRSRRAT
jgi:hypothetical protein